MLTPDRQIFLASVLSELRGHELQVATDPDTAVVLERLLPSLNDWGRRVIGDAIGEQWETLLRHRFGSHVAQTWLTLAAGTLDREVSMLPSCTDFRPGIYSQLSTTSRLRSQKTASFPPWEILSLPSLPVSSRHCRPFLLRRTPPLLSVYSSSSSRPTGHSRHLMPLRVVKTWCARSDLESGGKTRT